MLRRFATASALAALLCAPALAQTPEEILAPKTVPEERLDECATLGEALAEGLAMGVF